MFCKIKAKHNLFSLRCIKFSSKSLIKPCPIRLVLLPQDYSLLGTEFTTLSGSSWKMRRLRSIPKPEWKTTGQSLSTHNRKHALSFSWCPMEDKWTSTKRCVEKSNICWQWQAITKFHLRQPYTSSMIQHRSSSLCSNEKRHRQTWTSKARLRHTTSGPPLVTIWGEKQNMLSATKSCRPQELLPPSHSAALCQSNSDTLLELNMEVLETKIQ